MLKCILVLSLLAITRVHVSAEAIDYRYSYVSVADSGKPCLNNCVNNKCVVSWDNRQEPCIRSDLPSPTYNTALQRQGNKHCLSNCATFTYDYTWCITAQDRSWDYCNPMVSYSYEEYDVYGRACLSPCGRGRTNHFTCDTDRIRQSYCALPARYTSYVN